MKKIILSAAVVLTASAISLGQNSTKEKKEVKIENPQEQAKKQQEEKKQDKPQQSPEKRAEFITKRMMKVTGAPAEKEVKIKEINTDTEKQREKEREKYAGKKDELKKARIKRNLERDEKLKAVFSEGEFSKWEAHKKEMKEKHKAKMQNGKASKADELMQDIVED